MSTKKTTKPAAEPEKKPAADSETVMKDGETTTRAAETVASDGATPPQLPTEDGMSSGSELAAKSPVFPDQIVATSGNTKSSDTSQEPADLGGEGNPAFPSEQAFAEDYPLLFARIAAAEENGVRVLSAVRISARHDGFRRAGMRHPKAAVEHPPASFTPDQLEQLLAEPNLTVDFI